MQQRREILETVAGLADAEGGLQAVLPDSPEKLLSLVRDRSALNSIGSFKGAVLEKAVAGLRHSQLASADRAHLEGQVRLMQDDVAGAVNSFSTAVQLAPERTHWRFQLAQLMERSGMIARALEQAKMCLRLEPSNDAYRSLLRDLRRSHSELEGGRLTREGEI